MSRLLVLRKNMDVLAKIAQHHKLSVGKMITKLRWQHLYAQYHYYFPCFVFVIFIAVRTTVHVLPNKYSIPFKKGKNAI